jgi:hypothetical protein
MLACHYASGEKLLNSTNAEGNSLTEQEEDQLQFLGKQKHDIALSEG